MFTRLLLAAAVIALRHHPPGRLPRSMSSPITTRMPPIRLGNRFPRLDLARTDRPDSVRQNINCARPASTRPAPISAPIASLVASADMMTRSALHEEDSSTPSCYEPIDVTRVKIIGSATDAFTRAYGPLFIIKQISTTVDQSSDA